MSDLNDLIAQLPIGSIAQALGVDEATANQAVQAALPALLGGLDANAQDEAGAASLQQALLQHEDRLPGDGQIDVDAVAASYARSVAVGSEANTGPPTY